MLKFVEAIQTFSPAPHRCEYLGEIAGISFYNDSKATNIDAAVFAVRAINRPIVLIAGGLDKAGDFSKWKETFLGKVKHIVAIGKAASIIQACLQDFFCVTLSSTLKGAFAQAFDRAKVGDAILLSPGCASFDQFLNYEERGNQFKDLFFCP